MNTKVKVGIAAAILAALVALVVLDHQTTPKDDVSAKPGSSETEAITVVGNGAAPPSTRLGEEEINTLLQNAQKQFAQPKPPATSIKSTEERNEKRIPSAIGDEYVIKDGDTFETIAQKTLGSKTLAHKIAEANPDMRATALRVGKTVKIPMKAEPKEEPIVVLKPAEPLVMVPVVEKKPAVETIGNQKIYTVQSGDTLSGISSKVYNTSRHYQKIYEANRDVISDPNTLQVGSKLVMPDLPAKSATANGASAGTVATTNPAPANVPAGARTFQVGEGSSLWKIAEKFAAEKKVGIHDMMKAIVAANPDKLKDEGTLLRLGWHLIIPE